MVKLLTTAEVAERTGRVKGTVVSWRRGYYMRKGVKIYFFEDQRQLDKVWTGERWLHSADAVDTWVNELNLRKPNTGTFNKKNK